MASSLSDILSTIQNGVIALNNLAVQMGFFNKVWTVYTPTVTSLTGVLTVVVGCGRYLKIGKTVFISVEAAITTNGTGGTSISITLPFTAATVAAAATATLVGRENNLTGNNVTGSIFSGAASMTQIVFYNNTYPGADGARISLSGVYESV